MINLWYDKFIHYDRTIGQDGLWHGAAPGKSGFPEGRKEALFQYIQNLYVPQGSTVLLMGKL
jgi:hypothetical protein